MSSNHLEPKVASYSGIVISKPASIKVVWKLPTYAANCVKQYQIKLNPKNNVFQDSLIRRTATNNITKIRFENLRGCISYRISISLIDKQNKTLQFVEKESQTLFPTGLFFHLIFLHSYSIRINKEFCNFSPNFTNSC